MFTNGQKVKVTNDSMKLNDYGIPSSAAGTVATVTGTTGKGSYYLAGYGSTKFGGSLLTLSSDAPVANSCGAACCGSAKAVSGVGVSYLGTIVVNGKSFIEGKLVQVDDAQIISVDSLTDIVPTPTPLANLAAGDVVLYNGEYLVVMGTDDAGFDGLSFNDSTVKKFMLTTLPGFPNLITKLTYAGANMTMDKILALGGYMKGGIGTGVAFAIGSNVVNDILAR